MDVASGLHVAGLLGETDRAREAARGSARVAGLEQHAPEVAVRSGLIRVERDHATQRVDGLAQPVQLDQCAREPEPADRVLGIGFEKLAAASDAFSKLIAIERTQGPQGIGRGCGAPVRRRAQRVAFRQEGA